MGYKGDSYREHGVKVVDVRDDDSDRTVKIEFSESPGVFFASVCRREKNDMS